MAPQRSADERMVTRTYRAAIKIGEDYITLEETVTLPIDAPDEDVAKAVSTGWRVYTAQREALEAQVQTMRDAQGAPPAIVVRDPDSPASDKQRNYIAALQDDLAWSSEQLVVYAQDQKIDLVTMTKGQASPFIDGLKKLAEERTRYGDGAGRVADQPAAADGGAAGSLPQRELVQASERQIRALQKLAQDRGVDLEAESQQRYQLAVADMSSDQASTLLSEWQRAGRVNGGRRTANESAL